MQQSLSLFPDLGANPCRRASGQILSQPTKLLSCRSRVRSGLKRIGPNADCRAQAGSHAGRDPKHLGLSEQKQRFRTRVVATGGAVLVPEQSPPLQARELEGEIQRLRALQERIRVAVSLEEKQKVLEKDPEVQRIWQALREKVECEDANQRFLLSCMIAAGQGHLLESVHLLKESGETNGVHFEAQDRESERAPYLEAFHMLADVVRKMEGSKEDLSTAPILQSSHCMPVNAHVWEERLTNGHLERPTAVRQAVSKLVNMLGRLDKFYDSIGGVLGYQLASLELIKASNDKNGCDEKKSSALWDESEPLSNENETKYHMPLGPDLAADQEFAQRAAAWGLEVRTPPLSSLQDMKMLSGGYQHYLLGRS